MVKAKRFKKGSPEAKAFMAKLRKMKGKKTIAKKVGATSFEKQKKVNDTINKKYAKWQFPVPPVYTGNWSVKDWENWITKNGSKIGAYKKGTTIFKEEWETPRKGNVVVKRRKKTGKHGAYKSFKRVSGVSKHKDTKSHNVNIRVVSGLDLDIFTRVKNDINGNPRYAVHFLKFLNEDEKNMFHNNYGINAIHKMYEYALKKAKKIGGRKFHNKQYGGGIVFQSYNNNDLLEMIKELRISNPKIKIK